MKFSFLFPHRQNDKWSTPSALITELQKRGHECRIYSCFNIDENQYTDYGIQKLLNDAWNNVYTPDIIFHMDFGLYKSPYLTKSLYPKAIWLFESGDDPQSFQGYNYPKAAYGNFDAIFSPDIRCTNIYKQRGYNAVWDTHFADTALYDERDPIPTYDAVSTRDPNEPFFIEIKKALGSAFHTSRGFHAKEHADFLKSGKIVLQNSRYKEVTRRLFEGMLAKRLVITDRLPKDTQIDTLFTEGIDIVYFDSIQDAIDKIKFYANNDKERNKIALNGYNNVLCNHTQVQRVNSLLATIERLKQ